MKREEAISLFEKQLTAAQVVLDSGFGSNPGENDFLYRRRKEMAEIALSALRPVSREHVEKVWKGRWITVSNTAGETWSKCSECQEELDGLEDAYNFCPRCGAPMTDEAVQMVMEREEALQNAD